MDPGTILKRKNRKAYVIFTREPVPGTTKTRLMPFYSAEKCAELHSCFLIDLAMETRKVNADIIVANHALFFTDLRLKNEDLDAGLLPKFGMAVIDEAHTLENNAAEHLGL
jgi:Rad3-related DNA helicase